ncbi:MAG: hypothetical protein H6Q99_1897 [Proteobacteria bacterium]|nr:hypothetical protein [Pseudomonadota bacterium]
MLRTIYTAALASILGLLSLSAFGQSTTVTVQNRLNQGAINAGIFKDGKLLLVEPPTGETGPASSDKGKTDSKSGKSRGDSIDSGHEGG